MSAGQEAVWGSELAEVAKRESVDSDGKRKPVVDFEPLTLPTAPSCIMYLAHNCSAFVKFLPQTVATLTV
jgi:hypothetical protein